MRFQTVTDRALATTRAPLTTEQAQRLQHLAACGPCIICPEVDKGLAANGWLAPYGAASVDLSDAATANECGALFDKSGRLHPWLRSRRGL